eukprot:3473105-Pyramimonas_sp.AAC.1
MQRVGRPGRKLARQQLSVHCNRANLRAQLFPDGMLLAAPPLGLSGSVLHRFQLVTTFTARHGGERPAGKDSSKHAGLKQMATEVTA